MSKPKQKKVLLSLDGGALRGTIQLQIINLLDEIIQEKKLAQVFEKYCHQSKPPQEIINNLFEGYKSSGDMSAIIASLGKESKAKIEDVECALKSTFMDYVDYVAGVSAGGLVASGLTVCDKTGNYIYTAQDLIQNFQTDNLLKKTHWYNWKTKFDQSFLKESLEETFKKDDGSQATFDDIKKAKLLITSYNIDDNKQTIFSNYRDNAKCVEDENLFQRYVDVAKSQTTLVDAAMSSSAIQFALPAYKISYTLTNGETITDTYEIDGGNIRQSPLLEAISAIIIEPKIKLKDLVVVSIGSGAADFDLSDLKDGSVFSYLKNFLGFGNDGFTISNTLCEASSAKNMVGDLVDDANNHKNKAFYDFNVELDRDLYKASLDPASVPLYAEATLEAYKEGSDNYASLVELADYVISLESH